MWSVPSDNTSAAILKSKQFKEQQLSHQWPTNTDSIRASTHLATSEIGCWQRLCRVVRRLELGHPSLAPGNDQQRRSHSQSETGWVAQEPPRHRPPSQQCQRERRKSGTCRVSQGERPNRIWCRVAAGCRPWPVPLPPDRASAPVLRGRPSHDDHGAECTRNKLLGILILFLTLPGFRFQWPKGD